MVDWGTWMKTKMEREEAVVGLSGGDEIEIGIEIERAKQRCRLVIDRIRILSSSSCSSLSSSSSCNRTLLRLAQSELSFLSRLPILPNLNLNLNLNSRSLNIGHLEAVVHILQQPFVKGVSRVCKPIPLPPLPPSSSSSSNLLNKNSKIHVDIVCSLNGNPVWFLVSARNPNYIFWNNNNYNASSCANNNNNNNNNNTNTNTNNLKKKKKKKKKKTFFLRTRIQQLLDAASHSPPSTKPCSIILFFSNGLDDTIRSKLEHEFGASSDLGFHFPHFHLSEELEGGGGGGDWIYPPPPPLPPPSPCVLQIKIDLSRGRDRDPIPQIECGGLKDSLLLLSAAAAATPTREDCIPFNLATSFFSLISRMKLGPLDVNVNVNVNDAEFAPQKDLSLQADLINFDTTALIALISGISNGSTHNILAKSESELRKRFKSNYEFVIAQVMSEIQNPIHMELGGVLFGKRGMICESVCSEFKELVSMCGGPNEKSRADHLLKCLMVVGDSPSARMMSLPTTRKLAYKNKVVFGTGDQWRAPTLTANMAFVRAISQTGMSLFTIEHRPRALTGE